MIRPDRLLLARAAAWLIVGCSLRPSPVVAQAAQNEPPPVVIEGWGTVTDPDGDCTLKADNGKLTITIPGTMHDLSTTTGGMSAPRVLRKVDGDFGARVEVGGRFEPGERANNPRTVPLNAAGLLVWHDDKNYVRFERRNWWVPNDRKYTLPHVIPEYFKAGIPQQWTNVKGMGHLEGPPVWLGVERRGDTLVTSFSYDGREWLAANQLTVDLPRTVWVGVLAINTSAEPFVAEFEEFTVGPTLPQSRPAEELKAVAPPPQAGDAAAAGNIDTRRFMLGMLGMYLFPLAMFFMCAITMLVCLLTRSTRAWFRLAAQARREHCEMLRSMDD